MPCMFLQALAGVPDADRCKCKVRTSAVVSDRGCIHTYVEQDSISSLNQWFVMILCGCVHDVSAAHP
jgi:hypothetical protein